MKWIRLSECPNCFGSRCVLNPANPRMGYCFRISRVFFVKEGRAVTGNPSCDKKLDKQAEFPFAQRAYGDGD